MALISMKNAKIEIHEPATEMIYIWEIKPYVPDWGIDNGLYKRLCDSITTHSLVNPPMVRRLKDGSYEVINGKLRILAARACGLHRILVIVNQLTDEEIAEYRRISP